MRIARSWGDPFALDPATASGTEVAAPSPDLAVFVHLLDSEGSPVAQGDVLLVRSDTFRSGEDFGSGIVWHCPRDYLWARSG